jgi:thioredoxin 2
MSAWVAACPRCGAKNRFPADRFTDGPVCGSCKSKLFVPEPVVGTDANFAAQVLEAPPPVTVLVDFWAPWCGPCRMMEGPLSELARDYAPQLKVVKVNVDENPQTAQRYRIQSIPQLTVFRGGQAVETIVGAQAKHALEARLAAHLTPD